MQKGQLKLDSSEFFKSDSKQLHNIHPLEGRRPLTAHQDTATPFSGAFYAATFCVSLSPGEPGVLSPFPESGSGLCRTTEPPFQW